MPNTGGVYAILAGAAGTAAVNYFGTVVPMGKFLQCCEEMVWGSVAPAVPVRNQAFVFIKPHANRASVQELVTSRLREAGMNVTGEGEITGEEIDAKRLIDQHYYAIMCKADILKPTEMNVPAEKFEQKFSMKWSDALDKGCVFNATDCCRKLGITPDELNKQFSAAKKAGNVVKFGGGFYCGKLDTANGPVFVFNGFYSTMRKAFTAPGSSIHYYTIDFDPKKMSWENFRDNFLGTTDPATSPAGSLRKEVLDKWQELGLDHAPNTGDNAVHASASPFEGLAERMNWLRTPINADRFGSMLLDRGISPQTIWKWAQDPQVKGASLFDQLENFDATPCADKAATLA